MGQMSSKTLKLGNKSLTRFVFFNGNVIDLPFKKNPKAAIFKIH